MPMPIVPIDKCLKLDDKISCLTDPEYPFRRAISLPWSYSGLPLVARACRTKLKQRALSRRFSYVHRTLSGADLSKILRVTTFRFRNTSNRLLSTQQSSPHVFRSLALEVLLGRPRSPATRVNSMRAIIDTNQLWNAGMPQHFFTLAVRWDYRCVPPFESSRQVQPGSAW